MVPPIELELQLKLIAVYQRHFARRTVSWIASPYLSHLFCERRIGLCCDIFVVRDEAGELSVEYARITLRVISRRAPHSL